jgi:hypothetical protein
MLAALALLFGMLLAVTALAALLLHWRDKSAKARGKTPEQIHSDFAALMQLKSTMQRAAPGLLLITFGIFFGVDRYREQDPEWWYCLLFIAIGWFLVPLLGRKSWKRYRELRKYADASPRPYIHYDPIE